MTVPHLLLVLRADSPPPVRAATAEQLGAAARDLGPDLVNRAIAAALPLPDRGALVVRCDGARCLRLWVPQPIAERVAAWREPARDPEIGAGSRPA